MPAVVWLAVKKMSAGLLSLVFPDDCRVCGKPLKNVSRVPVCPACLSEPEPFAAEYQCVCCRTPFLNPHPLDASGRCALCRLGLSGFDAVYAYGSYEGSLRKLIQLFKYGRIPTLAAPLGRLLAAAVPRERAFDVIVPMPMHWRRRWSRGFNQAELLARTLEKRLGLPVRNAVRRVKATPPQAGLTAGQRRANMSAAFQIKRPEIVRGKRVLLVDDVFTTGATAGACARTLKRAGAAYIAVLTVARADRRMPDTLHTGKLTKNTATPSLGSVLDAQSGSTA
jgi:ComF family protein